MPQHSLFALIGLFSLAFFSLPLPSKKPVPEVISPPYFKGIALHRDPAGNCQDFCSIIQVCAQTTDHPELAPLLCKTARCETGDKCVSHIRSPSGRYEGPFQFLVTTWDTECTPRFEQRGIARCSLPESIYDLCCATICAAELIADGSLSYWPVCGEKAFRNTPIISE